MPSIFYETKHASWLAHRQASIGTSITLVCGIGEYVATFDCAKYISLVLGSKDMLDLCDGVKCYRIPFDEMPSTLAKLRTRFSVALVDITQGKHGARFVMIAKIDRLGNAPIPAPPDVTPAVVQPEPVPDKVKQVYTVDDF